jgi:hypothetical protein
MNRTTTAKLKNAVGRLNYALQLAEGSKGRFCIARMHSVGRIGWQLRRDYDMGMVAVTGFLPAGDVFRHIEAMLDGIAAARGLPVPRSIYDAIIKRSPAPAAEVTSQGLETNDGDSDCPRLDREGGFPNPHWRESDGYKRWLDRE